ncbi:DNA-repair protein XRCC1 [Culex quinquefasciatus]|uniref:DNA-repair protein XRCC1 n=1 Tax=Culex quinquefasciatus TaxID=7176 RepID=B0WZK0_CULQU|nr:DNA-repair protein XRCC1 [Culex quinquefasciatus]|eukprot:XP_001862822.1 DNA-repair protein XRCC1 [Culex quinquefasciatus]
MPTVSLASIESFSSEDPNFPASNLLAKETRRWKCRDAGEKSAFVVFRLDGGAVCITGIDIGNEHSAFVEVLVGRSGPAVPEFKEILLTSSFMSPIESRNSTNSGRVRCFTAKELVESVARERWDLVKVICTQPFNSRVQYGVAFVTLHSGGGERKDKPLVPAAFQRQIQEEGLKKEPSRVVQLGRFKLREESPDSDEGSEGLFARWKAARSGADTQPVASKPATTPARAATSTAAAIRDASTPAAIRNSLASPQAAKMTTKITPKPKPRLFDDDEGKEEASVKPRDRNRDALLYDKEDDKPNEKLERKLAEDRARKQREKDAKEERERRERSLSEKKKEKLHDTSATKFKNFLFDEPETSSEKKSSSEKDRRKDEEAKRSRDREKKSSPERKKRPTESSSGSRDRTSEIKKPKLDKDREEDEERTRKPVTYKPFNKLLEKVVLVISGIQNPDRANLRNQALAMGAKYKSDWDSSCTHLICAFKNTPKYNQVHGQGKIVRKGWIERCHALRKRLSWRKFALDSDETERSDSEGEIVDEARRPKQDPPQRGCSPVKDPSLRKETDEEALAHYDLDDVAIVEDKPPTYELSGSDTEEEIERVKQKQREQVKDRSEVYDKSTEEEEGRNGGEEKEKQLDFFKRKRFLLDDDVGAVDVIKLERYVELYKG